MRVFVAIFIYISFLGANEIACSNPNLEVTCSDGKCQKSESFTPSQIILSRELVKVCTYSECFQDSIRPYKKNQGYFYSSNHFQSESHQRSFRSFHILYLPKEHIALLQGSGFAMPMECGGK